MVVNVFPEWCSPGQHICSNSKMCVDSFQVCDGISHCPFGDDEKNCVTISPSVEEAAEKYYFQQGCISFLFRIAKYSNDGSKNSIEVKMSRESCRRRRGETYTPKFCQLATEIDSKPKLEIIWCSVLQVT